MYFTDLRSYLKKTKNHSLEQLHKLLPKNMQWSLYDFVIQVLPVPYEMNVLIHCRQQQKILLTEELPWHFLFLFVVCLTILSVTNSTSQWTTGWEWCMKRKGCESLYSHNVGWNSVVSIATRYELDGPQIKSWRGQDFLHLSSLP